MDFRLRAWNINDAPVLPKYANNFNIAKFMTDRFPHPYTVSDAQAFIEFANRNQPVHIFAIDINGEAVGGIGIHPQEDVFRKNAELGYWLAEPFWGNDVISNAIPQIIDFAFKTYDITRIFARPFGTNKASQRVLEKTGFKPEARVEKILFKGGEWLDELVYAFRRKP